MTLQKQHIAYYGTALIIVVEVILINLLSYAVDIYLPAEVGPYLSLEILFCLPLMQAARMVAINALDHFGNAKITLAAIIMAIIWSEVESSIHPGFPITILFLNIFTRGVALTLLGRVFFTLWHDREIAHKHINEHSIVEKSLRVSENKLAKALNMAKAGSWDYDIIDDTFTFDDNFYNIFKTSIDEIGSYNMSSAEYTRRFVHPDDRDLVKHALTEATQSQDQNLNHDLEHRIIYQNGETGYIKVRFFTVTDQTGKTIRSHGVNLDITERKQKEEELLNLNQQLQELSNLDGLLGIANRRYFDLHLEEEWNRAQRNKQPLSLLMIDVDRFKHFNDSYGHQAGDKCLQILARTSEKLMKRSGDLLARYGGEELTVILPNTDTNGALVVAKNIQHQLARERIPHDGIKESPYLTVSIGIATMTPDSDTTPFMLISAADKGMYLSKKHGRNLISVGSENDPINEPFFQENLAED